MMAMAWVSGVPVSFLRYLFLVVLALSVVVSIYLVGIILVEALLVIPGAVARNLTRQIRHMAAVSAGVAVGSTVTGLAVSYWLDLPTGAAIVGVLSMVFFVTSGLSSRKKAHKII